MTGNDATDDAIDATSTHEYKPDVRRGLLLFASAIAASLMSRHEGNVGNLSSLSSLLIKNEIGEANGDEYKEDDDDEEEEEPSSSLSSCQ